MSQTFNLEGLLFTPYVLLCKRQWLVPHFSVADMRCIDPEKLREYGFKGVVFDKDNTLTAPYVDAIYPSISEHVEHFKSVFGRNLAIMSNSAGTHDDHQYESAKRIERNLGITVLRHDEKKPGGIEAVTNYFHEEPHYLVAIGDRVLTDIVFGNRYGMLTILTAPFTEIGDNKAAAIVRRYERKAVQYLMQQGRTAPPHQLYQRDICSGT